MIYLICPVDDLDHDLSDLSEVRKFTTQAGNIFPVWTLM